MGGYGDVWVDGLGWLDEWMYFLLEETLFQLITKYLWDVTRVL